MFSVALVVESLNASTPFVIKPIAANMPAVIAAAPIGLNKKLTWYVARHTFATTVTLGNGIKIENVSAMLGHTTIKQTQHYAKVLDNNVMDDMQKLKEKYINKNN